MKVAAVIVAAGIGVRAGGVVPKQYRKVNGEAVLRKTVRAFAGHPDVSAVQVVVNPEHKGFYEQALSGLNVLAPVKGGMLRQDSVLAGLKALIPLKPDIVLIHDAARAFVSPKLIARVIKAVEAEKAGAVPALPVADTLKQEVNGAVVKTVDRSGLWLAQTPQGFPFGDILQAHQTVKSGNFTDDAGVAEAAGLKVVLIEGEKENVKLTTPEDFKARSADVRTGTGFDVHAFAPGDHVMLCGVKIPHDHTLKGHSDADAGLHALTDALLGAIGAGDIGDHFPPGDPKWKNAASEIFLKHAAKLVRDQGAAILNVDVTLICEQPRIGPHREAMRQAVARILGIEAARVSVKATTTEALGFTGRGEGLAAQAIATVGF
jgi:2-C-methyl-D-erythritol 4-phosphate cytidylyltransferase / 2-C-methyl-D-erythritol 2,4-cyclodiphosphate synthase